MLQSLTIDCKGVLGVKIRDFNCPIGIGLDHPKWSYPFGPKFPWEEFQACIKQPDLLVRLKGFSMNESVVDGFHFLLIQSTIVKGVPTDFFELR